MKKLLLVPVVVMLMLTWFSANAFAEFYVISTPKEVEVMPDNYAPVEKSGETLPYATGCDGDLEAGVTWPSPRFTDNSNGTVTDNLTGLIWLKNADILSGQTNWVSALNYCNNLADNGSTLTDSSSAGDWRLPTIKELQSLIHYAYRNPTVPNTAGTGKWSEGNPFTGVQNSTYWSSTTDVGFSEAAWYVAMSLGTVNTNSKVNTDYVWPVRDAK